MQCIHSRFVFPDDFILDIDRERTSGSRRHITFSKRKANLIAIEPTANRQLPANALYLRSLPSPPSGRWLVLPTIKVEHPITAPYTRYSERQLQRRPRMSAKKWHAWLFMTSPRDGRTDDNAPQRQGRRGHCTTGKKKQGTFASVLFATIDCLVRRRS